MTIIYHKNMLRPELMKYSNTELIKKHSFSQSKPSKLLPSIDPDQVLWMTNYGVGKDDLYTVHDKEYIDNLWAEDKTTAEYSLATVNAHFYAAKLAWQHKCAVVAPVSGFHHAGYDYGWGFCYINGLMYSAKRLGVPVAIIDGDTHEGDGCIDIKNRLKMDNVFYFSKEKGYNELLAEIPKDCLIFYQAGVDGHVDDPFGGTMQDTDYQERENVLLSSGRPMVVNLAGGYNDHALELHLETVKRFGYEQDRSTRKTGGSTP